MIKAFNLVKNFINQIVDAEPESDLFSYDAQFPLQNCIFTQILYH